MVTVFRNKEFASVRALCRFYKISPKTISSRLARGWTLEEAISSKKKQPVKFNVKNVDYYTLKDLACAYKMSANTINRRLTKGWSIEEALELINKDSISLCSGKVYKIVNTTNDKLYIGITTRSLKERFAQHKNSANKNSNLKLHKAMRAIGLEKFSIFLLKETDDWYRLGKLEHKYIKKYDSLKSGYNSASGRQGSFEKLGIEIKYKGKKFISLSSLARNLNISNATLLDRLNRNISLDKPTKKYIKIRYRNKVYDSIKQLSVFLNVDPMTIKYRIQHNYCVNGPPKMTGKRGFYKAYYEK